MATLTVTTLDDLEANDGKLSLREAVSQANATGDADTIRFQRNLEGGTLVLKGGELNVTSDLTVDGDSNADGKRVTIDGDDKTRIVSINGAGVQAGLTDLALTGGNAKNTRGGAVFLGSGASLAVSRSDLSGNAGGEVYYGAGKGGAIYAAQDSRLTITNSQLTKNLADNGGGIYAAKGSQVGITRSLLQGNSGAGYRYGRGGGIASDAAVINVTASTIADNFGGGDGGGISARGGRVTLTRSTVSGNDSAYRLGYSIGGGIRVDRGILNLRSSTVTGNTVQRSTSSAGAGIVVSSDSQLRTSNSVVVGNYQQNTGGYARLADDVSGSITSSNGHNLFGNLVTGAAYGDKAGVPARRVFAAIDDANGGGELARNGGPTPTVKLRDAADNPALARAALATSTAFDQRGIRRPQPPGTKPDIGAFELPQRSTPPAPSADSDVLSDDASAGLSASHADTSTANGGSGYDIVSDAGKGRDLKVVRQASAWLVSDHAKAAGNAGRDLIANSDLGRVDDHTLDLATRRSTLRQGDLVASAGEHGHAVLAGT